MAAFPFHHLTPFAGKSTTIRRPREFTYFSFDDQHKLLPLSDASLSYYYPAFFQHASLTPHRFDLSAGFDSFRQRDDGVDEHLDALLDTLQAHEERELERARDDAEERKLEDVRCKADVVTWRGMMTKILTAPFDDFNEFEMNATCFQGTIFVEENHQSKEAQRQSQNAQRPRPGQASQELMQYWGYKFEALSTLSQSWPEATRESIESRDEIVVNNHAQYCSIVRTGIGTTSLIIGGEVDCVLGQKPDNIEDPVPWVELKTTAELQSNHPRELVKFERKLLRYWAQSFLLGVPIIVVGFRTPNGLLTGMQELKTQRIPSEVKQGQRTWDGNVCINFTAAFLDVLKATVVGEGVWRIRRRKNQKVIEIMKVEESGTGQIVKESFKAHREKLMALEISAKLGQ
ncbi:protein rai1 [Hortaea werneckii]|uniref:Decapping nuclease n=1 Tax=Hortaea werneckii TaxID=91943 RepID=A0A3M7C929_HORWE|nr:protein rai1 [Hortaea werneckii]RMY48493.1 hypothetical protein D0865_08053 [Hortaea werneckii]